MWDLLSQKGMTLGSKIPHQQLVHCVTEAVEVAWSMITTIPPRIATCDPKDHLDDDLHHVVGDIKQPPKDGEYELIYNRPVLFTSCAKKILLEGRVRIVRSDDATASVLKKDSGSNSSGAKIFGKDSEYQEFCIAKYFCCWYDLCGELSDYHNLSDYWLDIDITYFELHLVGLPLGFAYCKPSKLGSSKGWKQG